MPTMSTTTTIQRRVRAVPAGAAVFFLLMQSACVEVAYKRGADESSFDGARQRCRAAVAADYERCMEKEGWSVYKPDDEKLNLALSPQPDNRGETPGPRPATLRSGTVDAKASYRVGSWWRIGGNSDSLHADAAACAESLHDTEGMQSLSGGGYRLSGALLQCLAGKGWRGLRAE
ncbi:MAG: hypothetical protein EKK46_14155 [Rhodocyclaceae bacterium]|nr:MAG: hypothetical protein EKK46_14155 [Rhodocyclaceae bacterium]